MRTVVKSIMWFLFIFLFNTACVNSQNKQKESNKNNPKVDIKVNKHYDDKGNVIGYDSSYSYIYSDTSNTMPNDSIFNIFHNFNNFNFPGFNLKSWNSDSTMNGDIFNSNPFFNDPFFNNNFGFQNDPFKEMEKMLRNMDSLRGRNNIIIPAPQPNTPKPDKPKKENMNTQEDKLKII